MAIAWKIEAQLGGDYATLVTADGPSLYLRANEASGAALADASGNGNTATLHTTTGVAYHVASGQPDRDYGLSFDGAHEFRAALASPIVTGTTFSLELWFTPNGASGSSDHYQTFIADHAGTAYGLYYRDDVNKIDLYFGADHFATVALTNGVRYHIVVSITAGAGTFYINGVAAGTFTGCPSITLAQLFSLDTGVVSAADPLKASLLDEILVYPTALSPAQVTLHYLAGQWTDLTADRAHPSDSPITLYGGIDGTGLPGDVMASPGLLTFALDNSVNNSGRVVGYYSPNSANRRAGWVDGIRCRLSVTIGANPTFYKFAGWIDDIIPQAGLYSDQTVQVVVSDWLGQAAGALAADVTAQAAKTGDQLTGSLVPLVDQPPDATSYDVGPDTYTYALDDITRESRVLDGLTSVAKSGLDRIYIKGDTTTGGVLRFESHSFRRTFIADAFAITDAAPNGQPGLALTDIQVARRRADRVNKVRFTMMPRKADSSNVVLYAENIDPATAVSIPAAGGSVTLWADYADPSQLAQQVAIVPGSGVAPVATTDYLLNSAANGSGTNLTASCTVVATYFGNTAKIVITNNHATLPAFRTFLQLRGHGIYAYQRATLEGSNGASARLYGERVASEDLPYQSSTFVAQAAADYYTNLTSSDAWTPVDAVSAFVPAADEATMWTLVNAETSTPFGVSESASGLSLYPMWINKWQLEIDGRDNVTFTFVPEPRDPNQYWSLGVAGLSELGSTTYFAPF